MAKPVTRIFDTEDKLVKGFTAYFCKLLNKKNGGFNVALSGGSTPKIWLEYLSNLKETIINWKRIHLFWGDERCVPPDHVDSNYGMTKSCLLDQIDIPKKNVHRIKGELDPGKAATAYARELRDHLPHGEVPTFDLIILGMGDDGHTASIFPYEIDLWNFDENCVVATHPVSGQKRVSFTGRVINNAHSVAFLINGRNKAQKVKEIINNESNASNYPASLVKPYKGELFWFLDADAASRLRNDQ
ncbi:MAG: 6-phosphogluconolactonase [Cytophagales bacterium]|nr:6-phosphogluconolactonase [Cytophagales bacterium]